MINTLIDIGQEYWMSRFEGYTVASGVEPEMAGGARQAVSSMTTLYDREQDLDILKQAGLTSVSMFYSAFT